jgi:hypothetical protein
MSDVNPSLDHDVRDDVAGADRLRDAKLQIASVGALGIFLILDFWATASMLSEREIMGRILGDVVAEQSKLSELAYSIPPWCVVVVSILIGVVVVAKEFVVKNRIKTWLINVVMMLVVSAAYWGYHGALGQPFQSLNR